MTSSSLISSICALAGLMAGGTAARLRPGNEMSPAVSVSHPQAEPSPKPEASGNSEPGSAKKPPTSRSRLLRLMNESSRGALSLAKAWKDAANDPAMRLWLAEIWIKEDPAAFIRMFYATDPAAWSSGQSMMMANLITRFAEQNPQAALKIGDNIQPPAIGRWLTGQAILKIMESDIHEGLKLAAGRPELRLNGNMDMDKIKVTAADIPLLMSLPRSGMVSDLLAKSMNSLPVIEALKLTPQMNSVSRRSVLTALSKRWVSEDPEAALNFAHTEATDAQRVRILESLGEKKIEANPAEAAAWAEQNLSGYAKNRVLDKAADKLEKTDPAAAEAIRARLPQNYSPKQK